MTDIEENHATTAFHSIIAATTVGELALRDCITLPRAATVSEAIEAMAENGQGAVAIVDLDDRIAGIFTERDVLLLGMTDMPGWHEQLLGHVATTQPVTVQRDEPLLAMLGKLRTGQFRHVPVVDADRKPTAMASVRDVLGYVAELFPRELVNLPPEPPLESRGPWGG